MLLQQQLHNRLYNDTHIIVLHNKLYPDAHMDMLLPELSTLKYSNIIAQASM